MDSKKANKFVKENYNEIKLILKEKEDIQKKLSKLYEEYVDLGDEGHIDTNERDVVDQYEDVVFLQGEEAEEPLRILNDEGEDAAMNYLKQWHYPGQHMTSKTLSHGSDDKTYKKGRYIMSWNSRIGYIGLQCEWLDELDETIGIGISHTVKRSAPQRLNESEEPKELRQINREEAESLFNQGTYIYIKTAPGNPDSTVNIFSLSNKTFDGSMNIYTAGATPEEYGFENILNWIEEREEYPLEFYTFDSKTPWVVNSDVVVKELEEGSGISMTIKKGMNAKPSTLHNTDVVVNENLRKKIQKILWENISGDFLL